MLSHKILSAVALLLGAGLALPSCSQGPEKIVLQREWTANAEFAGDVWAAEIAKSHGLNLVVREGSQAIDPVKEVRSGSAYFGVASADRILRENEGGAQLVVLGAATFKSPVVFLSNPELQIRTPAAFRTRTIGIQAGTNTELVFQALLNAQSIVPSDMKVVDSGWGTGTFETGTVDVLAAFAYDEPISLRIKGKQFDTLQPDQFGVSYVGTVYFTRKALVESKPALVQTFVSALVAGWGRALESPTEALMILSRQFDDIRTNLPKETQSLAAGAEYFEGEGGRVLYASPERWESMARSLITLGKIKSFVFDENVDYRFLDRASAGK